MKLSTPRLPRAKTTVSNRINGKNGTNGKANGVASQNNELMEAFRDRTIKIDVPYNIACDLAFSIIDSHKDTGTWEPIEVLLARKDQWLERGLVMTKTVRSFRSRTVDQNGKTLLILSCRVDGNDYVFDLAGLGDREPPVVVATSKGQAASARG